MPELPEVETVVRSLRPRLVGRTVERVETSGLALRAPVDRARLAAACTGARVEAVDRIGKYLVFRLSGAETVLIHLGMSGALLVAARGAARDAHTHAVFHLDGPAGGGELRYVDPRRFGLLLTYPAAELERSPEIAALGPDPLSADFTPAILAAALASSRRDVKQLLLDQGRVAGLGNIYVCEALHRAGISPRRRAHRLGAARCDRLHEAIRAVLAAAVARRGTTFRSYVDAAGERGDNQGHLAVYGRAGAPCPVCGAPIARIVQGARSTFFCPRCQR